MFRSMIIRAIVMVMTVSRQDHTHHIEVAELSFGSTTIASTELEAGHQHVLVAETVIACTATRFHTVTVTHWII